MGIKIYSIQLQITFGYWEKMYIRPFWKNSVPGSEFFQKPDTDPDLQSCHVLPSSRQWVCVNLTLFVYVMLVLFLGLFDVVIKKMRIFTVQYFEFLYFVSHNVHINDLKRFFFPEPLVKSFNHFAHKCIRSEKWSIIS